jgi:splicing factor 45
LDCFLYCAQVGTELTKYGTVTDVMIFEVTTPGYPPEEAVRIFAQFDRTEAATRALVDLQGRFFGGRQVSGSGWRRCAAGGVWCEAAP